MNMSYSNHDYRVWNKAADLLLCAASTMGVITALFFLLTL